MCGPKCQEAALICVLCKSVSEEILVLAEDNYVILHCMLTAFLSSAWIIMKILHVVLKMYQMMFDSKRPVKCNCNEIMILCCFSQWNEIVILPPPRHLKEYLFMNSLVNLGNWKKNCAQLLRRNANRCTTRGEHLHYGRTSCLCNAVVVNCYAENCKIKW